MADRVQTYKNHTRFLPAFHFFVIPVLAANFVNEARHLYTFQTLGAAFTALVAFALLGLGFLARTQALAAQDRVIRLEMRLKLRQLLPPELQARINDLPTRQLVALRFASDAELAEIAKEVLEGKLSTSKEIKLRVRNWQADWQRV